MIATDLFELDKLNYLIVVDYFSRYIKVAAMQKTSKSLEVIEVIESNVHKTWNPRRSDNGPQYPCVVSSISRAVLASHNPIVR